MRSYDRRRHARVLPLESLNTRSRREIVWTPSVERLGRLLPAGAAFEIRGEHDLRGELVEPLFAALLGESRGVEDRFGFGAGVALVEEIDRHTGELPEPGAERAGFARFLTLMATR